MKRNKLQREADKTLKEFNIELKQTKQQVVKIKHQMIGFTVLPFILIPLFIGYAIFKKNRSQVTPLPIESESSHKQIIQKQPAFPWLSSIIKEICFFVLGRVASNLLKKS